MKLYGQSSYRKKSEYIQFISKSLSISLTKKSLEEACKIYFHTWY